MLFIFDMGGVVTTNFSTEQIYKSLNLTKEEFDLICNYDFSLYSKLEKGEISVNEFWNIFNTRSKIVITEKKVSVIEHDLFRLFFHPVLNEETVKIIKALKKKHRVVCGTNTIQSHWENHTERGDYAFFDQTYASNKINEIKPNENFYKLILQAENCKPEESFFVDDKIENVLAAKNVGINAVQFTNAKDLKKLWKKYY